VRASERAVDVADARRTFRDLHVTRLGSVMPDGSPHVVPLWFVWLEDAIFVSCSSSSRAFANVRRDPRVSLEFDRGRSWTELAGVLVRGRAEPLGPDDPSARRPLSAWFEKYRSELAGEGFAAYAEQVPEPVLLRVRPERLARWLHRPYRTR
jgi:PPOX class probable F420-dependent enzyme